VPREITQATLAEAEKLAALELDDAERELVRARIGALIATYAERRALALPETLSPALGFNPLLPGETLPELRDGFARSPSDGAPLPWDDVAIAFAPLSGLSRWLESRALSSRRLTELYLARLRRHGPTLECVVTLCEERALAQADRADREIASGGYRGPLHGVPWGAKDLLDTAGIATTWGATPYQGRIPDADARVVTRLEAAGAVLVAKLSLGELAQGDVWFGGKTRNPWQPGAGSGGSSAGSASAVAAGLVGFAIGSETLGSITFPCATCGATGLRPTFGRVPRSGAMPLAWSLDKLGPICRSAEDTALVLAAIHGRDDGDPDSVTHPFGFDAAAPVRGLRVGFSRAWFEAAGAHPSELAALDVLRELGAELVDVAIPDLPYVLLLRALIFVESAAAFEELTFSGRDDLLRQQESGSWPNVFRTARFVPAVEYVQLQRVRRRVMEAAAAIFRAVDVVVGPGSGGPMLLVSNASGHPALTVRAGFRADGTPTAVTLHGRLFDEGRLCRLGAAFEHALGIRDRRPPLD
jgi:Asp-tRNA(Asn)/Glu-tRNA(Gln) amidotransferase A subunit family amidase